MMGDRKFEDVMVERKSVGCGLEMAMKASPGGQWNPAAAGDERVVGDVATTLQRQPSRREKMRKRTLNDSDLKLNGEKRRRFNTQTPTTSESSLFASPTVAETVSQRKMVPLASPGYLDAVALFWWRQQLISRCMFQFPATECPAPLRLLPPPISALPPLPPVGATPIPSFPSTAFQLTSLRPTYTGSSDVTVRSSAGANSGYVTQTKTPSDGRDGSITAGRLQPFDPRHPTPTGCPSPTVAAHAPNDVIVTAAACPRVLREDRKLDCSATKRPRSDFSIPSILAGGRFGSAGSTVSSSSGVDSDVTTDVDECRSSLSGTSASGFYDDRSRSSTSRSSTIDPDEDGRLSGPMFLLTTQQQQQQQQPSVVMTQSSACFRCAECGAPFATSSGLSRHQKLQCVGHRRQLSPAAAATTDVSSSSSSNITCRRFDCPQCEKVYSSLGALKMHIRTHTLPCRCPVCSKSFSRPWLLQGHLRTHTGERPFSCVLCQRAFADRSNLRAHEQTHSAVKRYRCGDCSRAFSRASLLGKHREAGVCGSGISR